MRFFEYIGGRPIIKPTSPFATRSKKPNEANTLAKPYLIISNDHLTKNGLSTFKSTGEYSSGTAPRYLDSA